MNAKIEKKYCKKPFKCILVSCSYRRKCETDLHNLLGTIIK